MNHIREYERRRAFSVWLRTGRLTSVRNAEGIELKFNPWHDPENGRFTFAGTGRYYGRGSGGSAESRGRGAPEIHYAEDRALPPISSMAEADAWRAEEIAKNGHKPGYRKAIEAQYQRYKDVFSGRLKAPPEQNRDTEQPSSTPSPRSFPSPSPSRLSKRPTPLRPPVSYSTPPFARGGFSGGGGRFAGGGASGSWDPPEISARASAEAGPLPDALQDGTPLSGTERSRQSSPEHWRKVERNGYLYEIDDQNRTRRVSGLITLNTGQGRSKTTQLAAGGSDRRTTDQGGHYIARRFNGPTEAFNHFAQNGSFNRSDYAKLENQWERAKRRKKQVRVKIVPVFEGSSQRPSALNVWFWIDGHRESQKLPNESKGERDGK